MSPSSSELPELPELWITGPRRAACSLALAHGAGAGMDTPFMEAVAEGLAGRDVRVIRFEFPYMAERRESGKRRPPDREPTLRRTWMQVIEHIGAKKLVIGGKSMGGRIASLVADEAGVAGLVCLGYPFHPSGRPDQLRIDHLRTLRLPTLIVQGERDALGGREEVGGYDLPMHLSVHWLTDGDHSFKPRKSSGKSLEDNLAEAVEVVVQFLHSLRSG